VTVSVRPATEADLDAAVDPSSKVWRAVLVVISGDSFSFGGQNVRPNAAI